MTKHKLIQDVSCTTWNKLFEIPTTNTDTMQDIINSINSYTDTFHDMNFDEMKEFIESQFVMVCSDGIVIFADGEQQTNK